MSTINQKRGLRFWGWIALAFLLGCVIGAIGLFVLLCVLQAMISYAPAH